MPAAGLSGVTWRLGRDWTGSRIIGGGLSVSAEKAAELGVKPGASFTIEVEIDGLVSTHVGIRPTPLPDGAWRFELDATTHLRTRRAEATIVGVDLASGPDQADGND